MDRALRDRWVAALRSGDYKQGRVYLHNSEGDTWCCLGVLCDVAGFRVTPRRRMFPTHRALQGMRLNEEIAYDLAHLNDDGASFGHIANVIEREV